MDHCTSLQKGEGGRREGAREREKKERNGGRGGEGESGREKERKTPTLK
jgi:hypothetical protein